MGRWPLRNGVTVAVIIPALNEEAALPGLLARIPAWVEQIIVVDNGSTDRTEEVAAIAGATVVDEPKRGYGRACLAGIRAARATDILVFLDADGSDYPEPMDRLVDPIIMGRADLVIGSRRLGHVKPGAMTLSQRLGNALVPALIHCLWGQRFTDLGPFRAIRAAALSQLCIDDQSYGWTVQMQIRAARFGLRCLEVPVDYAHRRAGRSKISGTWRGVVGAITRILACVARERFRPSIAEPRRSGRLAVFTKHPEPGLVKTRLIPLLGPQGAADLHAQMVAHTLVQVGRFTDRCPVSAEIWLGGGTIHDFERRFASHQTCHTQPQGDLGARMLSAFWSMLATASSAVIIGTDCPEVSPGVLRDAFAALRTHDLVLGPAGDGGFYLIGLRRPMPALFDGIQWSTTGVLTETLRRARQERLRVSLLPLLDDVDEPKDLPVWERVRRRETTITHVPELSVVIPTLNEAERIGRVIRAVARPRVEVIVADGGSTDGTRRIASECGARVLVAPQGRGPQLNAGAAAARAPSLLFLHADTTLPPDYVSVVRDTLGQMGIVAGAFRLRIDRAGMLLRCIEAAVLLRGALFRTPYGDQALFMRTATFNGLGGFAPIPLMEDLELIRRARSRGAITVVNAHALTSARRWASAGVVRTTLVNQACIAGFALGISPTRVASWRHRVSAPRREAIGDDQMDSPGSDAPIAARTVVIAGGAVEARK